MRKAMPSPNNTNHERLFLPAGPVMAAYDEDPGEPMDYSALIAFLDDKLEDTDIMKVKRMLGLDDDAGDPASGASDGAMNRYRAEARDMHRRGLIGDAELTSRLVSRTVPHRTVVTTTKLSFQHANRLK